MAFWAASRTFHIFLSPYIKLVSLNAGRFTGRKYHILLRQSQHEVLRNARKGTQYATLQQPEWFKQFGGAYEAVKFNKRSKALTRVCLPAVTQCTGHEVLIRVSFAGVCSNDTKMIDGESPCIHVPVVPGHEISGYVSKVGSQVKDLAVGDRVAVNPLSYCTYCEECMRMRPNFCSRDGLYTMIGAYRDGGWAEYCSVPENQVFKLSPAIRIDHAVLFMKLSCLIHAWNLVMPAPPSTSFLVIGAGINGKLLLGMLHSQGYRNVIVTETFEPRREMLRRYECANEYDILHPDEVLKLKAAKNRSWGVDVVFCCSSNAKAMSQACTWLRKGGKMVIFGNASPKDRMEVDPMQIFNKELQIMGSFLNPFTFTQALDWVKNLGCRYLDFPSLGIELFPLEGYHRALEAVKEGVISKAVFKFDK